ncbi:MAG: hypothetical protein ACI8RD_003960, partial [Bacillariaceae sp.]
GLDCRKATQSITIHVRYHDSQTTFYFTFILLIYF